MRSLISLAVLAAIPLCASAQQCKSVQAYAPAYVQQAYVAPAYQIVQPVAVATFLVPNSHYSVEPDLAAARIQQQIADDAADRAIAKMLQLLRQQQGAPAPGVAPPGIAPPQANLGPVPGDHPSSLTTKVQTMANAKCVNCHHDATNKIDLRDVTKVTDSQAAKIVLRTTLNPGDPGAMPKAARGSKAESLTAQEYDDVAHWAYEVSTKGAVAPPKAALPVVPMVEPKESKEPKKIPPASADPKAKKVDGDDEGGLVRRR